ncbi:MAG: hypothetical protein QG652_1549, partial [Pseudomonadota bacterium]|nr:hypothetical protein [Pseudomonadota bacterium]
HLRHLYSHLYDNGWVKNLEGVRPELLSIYSHEILSRIRANQNDWENCVPPVVARMIREKHLFGCGDIG